LPFIGALFSGAPIGIGPSSGEYGVFLYLSLEHPLF
jgi:hypothetical protein